MKDISMETIEKQRLTIGVDYKSIFLVQKAIDWE